MKEFIIMLALQYFEKILQRKEDSKVRLFILNERTKNTFDKVYNTYNTVYNELKDKEAIPDATNTGTN